MASSQREYLLYRWHIKWKISHPGFTGKVIWWSFTVWRCSVNLCFPKGPELFVRLNRYIENGWITILSLLYFFATWVDVDWTKIIIERIRRGITNVINELWFFWLTWRIFTVFCMLYFILFYCANLAFKFLLLLFCSFFSFVFFFRPLIRNRALYTCVKV